MGYHPGPDFDSLYSELDRKFKRRRCLENVFIAAIVPLCMAAIASLILIFALSDDGGKAEALSTPTIEHSTPDAPSNFRETW